MHCYREYQEEKTKKYFDSFKSTELYPGKELDFINVHKLLDPFTSIHKIIDSLEPIKEIAKDLNPLGSQQKMLSSVDTYKAIAESIQTPGFLQDIYGSKSLSKTIIEAINLPRELNDIFSSTYDIINSFGYSNEAIKSFQSLLDSSSLESAMKALSQPANFASAIDLIKQETSWKDYVSVDDFDIVTVNESLVSLANAGDSESFKNLFDQLPYYLKVILLSICLYIILPVSTSIFGNLITPYIEDIISTESYSDRDKVRTIKKFNFEDIYLPSEDLRFISGRNVRLRSGPSIKSETLDLLRLGQLVVFLEKDRNWTKVLVQYGEDDFVSGWVFTRHVEKFRKY